MVGLNKTPLKPLKVVHFLTASELTNIRRYLGLAPSTSDAMAVKSLAKSIGKNRISKLY